MVIDLGDEAADGLQGLAGVADELDAAFNFLRRVLDQPLDFLGCTCRALSKFAHFLGDDGKALAGLAGTGGFHAGIEREKIGLEGDLVDDDDDVGDLLR